MVHKVVIIGSGPAGYSAALYSARALLNPVMIAGRLAKGQLMKTTDIENYPSQKSISGPDLMDKFHDHAELFGTTFINKDVVSVNFSKRPFKLVLDDEEMIECESVIIATGANPMMLYAEGESKLQEKGLISTCATCDGFFHKNRELVVVGGGDTAIGDAIFLSRFASKVTIVHRRDAFRSSKIMLERAKQNKKIHFKTPYIVKKWMTDDFNNLSNVLLENTTDNSESVLKCEGAFIAIGHKPSTQFLNNQIDMDEEGYIKLHENTMTSIPGVFAGGDCCANNKRYRQAITSASDGAKCAMDVEKWLEGQELVEK